jgi:hypothetical protein
VPRQGRPTPGIAPGRDALDVQLDDPELRAEMELTVQLMVRANESPVALSQEEIDTCLGVAS